MLTKNREGEEKVWWQREREREREREVKKLMKG